MCCNCCLCAILQSSWVAEIQNQSLDAHQGESGRSPSILLQANLRMVAGCLELLDQHRQQLIVAHFDGTQHVTIWTNENWDAETNLSHFMVKDHTLLRNTQNHEQVHGSERSTSDAVDRAAALVVALDAAMFPAHRWALEQQLMVFPRTHVQPSQSTPGQRSASTDTACSGGAPKDAIMLTLHISAKSNRVDEEVVQSTGTKAAEATAPRTRGPTYDIRLQMLPYHIFLRRQVVDGLMFFFRPPETVARHVAARKHATFERATSWRSSSESTRNRNWQMEEVSEIGQDQEMEMVSDREHGQQEQARSLRKRRQPWRTVSTLGLFNAGMTPLMTDICPVAPAADGKHRSSVCGPNRHGC